MCLINIYDNLSLEPDDLPMIQILDPLGEFKEGTKESTDGPAVYCDDCEMWLNGSTQFEDHKISKKHKKSLRRKQKTLPLRQTKMGVLVGSIKRPPQACVEEKEKTQ